MDTAFYKLTSPDSERFMASWVDDEIHMEQVICPINKANPMTQHRFGGYRLSPLVVKVHPHGLKDMIWTWYSDILVSNRMVDLLNKHSLTGWDLAPATVIARGERIVGEYHELVITGWGGELSPESGIRKIESCEGCGREEFTGWNDASKLLDHSQWDGSDFFRTYPLQMYVWASGRLVDVLKSEKVKHFGFKRVDELVLSGRGMDGGYWASSPKEEAITHARVLLGQIPPPKGRKGVVGIVGEFPSLI